MKRLVGTTIFVVLASLLLLLPGCGVPAQIGEEFEKPEPDQVVQQFIDALTTLDLDRAKSFVSDSYASQFDSEYEELKEVIEEGGYEADAIQNMLVAIYNNTDFQITGYEVDGSTARVMMDNQVPDMEQLGDLLIGRLFELMVNEEIDLDNFTEEEELQFFVEIFSEVITEVEQVAMQSEIPMVEEEGQWKIDGSVIENMISDLEF